MARVKSSRSAAPSPPKKADPSASFLDELLPLAEPTETEIHRHAAVLEVSDPLQLLELASDTALRPYLIARLAPNIALVDPGLAEDLADVLRRRGHTPKILKSGASR